MKNIYFLRHFQSIFNKNSEKLNCDLDLTIIDSLLSEEGLIDANSFIKNQKIKWDQIWVSPLRRALQTARIIGQKCSNIKVMPLFRERVSNLASLSIFYGEFNQWKDLREEWKDFNWNELKTYKKYWLLEEIKNKKSENILKNCQDFECIKKNVYIEIHKKVQCLTEGLEERKTDRERGLFINNYLKENKNIIEGDNLLIISHGFLIKGILGNIQKIESGKLYKLSI